MTNMKYLSHDNYSLVKINHFFCHFNFAKEETGLERLRNLFSLLVNHVNRSLNPGPFDPRDRSWQAMASGPNLACCLLLCK